MPSRPGKQCTILHNSTQYTLAFWQGLAKIALIKLPLLKMDDSTVWTCSLDGCNHNPIAEKIKATRTTGNNSVPSHRACGLMLSHGSLCCFCLPETKKSVLNGLDFHYLRHSSYWTQVISEICPDAIQHIRYSATSLAKGLHKLFLLCLDLSYSCNALGSGWLLSAAFHRYIHLHYVICRRHNIMLYVSLQICGNLMDVFEINVL